MAADGSTYTQLMPVGAASCWWTNARNVNRHFVDDHSESDHFSRMTQAPSNADGQRQCTGRTISEASQASNMSMLLRTMTGSVAYQWAIGVLVVTNTVLLTIEANYMGDEAVQRITAAAEGAFVLAYIVDIGLRLFERGLVSFLSGRQRYSNIFDLVTTATGAVDTLCHTWAQRSAGSSAQVFRIVRIFRLFRACRLFAELDEVVNISMTATSKFAGVVGLVIYVASLVATDLLWDAEDEHVANSFGSLRASMWTLFKIMTLDGWAEIVDRAIEAKPVAGWFFAAFVFLSVATMTLVPAVFIELDWMRREKAKASKAEEEGARVAMWKRELVRGMFLRADADCSGAVTQEELREMIRDIELGKHRPDEWDDDLWQCVKLGLCEIMLSKRRDGCSELSMGDFMSVAEKAVGQDNPQALWHSVAAVRLQVAELAELVACQEERHARQLLEILARLPPAEAAAAQTPPPPSTPASSTPDAVWRRLSPLRSRSAGGAAPPLGGPLCRVGGRAIAPPAEAAPGALRAGDRAPDAQVASRPGAVAEEQASFAFVADEVPRESTIPLCPRESTIPL